MLSTISSAPASWAIWAMPVRSAMPSSGFVGVSTQITRVPASTAPRTASSEVTSTGVCRICQGARTLVMSRLVPP